MIKMIAGTFGGTINGKLTAITPAYGPFSADEATEKRLVNAGVAEFVEAPAGGNAGNKKPDEPVGLAALSYPELQKLAKEKGIDPNGKKVELIARLEAAGDDAENEKEGTEDDDKEGDENPPDLSNVNTVV